MKKQTIVGGCVVMSSWRRKMPGHNNLIIITTKLAHSFIDSTRENVAKKTRVQGVQ